MGMLWEYHGDLMGQVPQGAPWDDPPPGPTISAGPWCWWLGEYGRLFWPQVLQWKITPGVFPEKNMS